METISPEELTVDESEMMNTVTGLQASDDNVVTSVEPIDFTTLAGDPQSNALK